MCKTEFICTRENFNIDLQLATCNLRFTQYAIRNTKRGTIPAMRETTQQPALTLEEAAQIARQRYGRSGTLTPLPGEYEQNFRLDTASGQTYILKIAPPGTPPELLEMQDAALAFIARRLPHACPQPVPPLPAPTDYQSPITDHRSPITDYQTRLLTWLPGTLYAHARPHTAALQRSLGRFMGQLDKILAGFAHPAAHRVLQWDLSQAAAVIDYTKHIRDEDDRALARRTLDAFQRHVLPRLPYLRQQIIHNDANDYNVLTQNGRVSGIVDFGDMVYTAVVHELAIACAYAILDQPDPRSVIAQVIAGYCELYPLLDEEIELLYPLIATRLAVSVTLAAYRAAVLPGNPYHQISTRPAWAALRRFSVFSGQFSATSPSPRPNPPALSLAYDEPLQIVRGYMQYLYDDDGRAYLDAVNNVPHVGHCHPRVVRAGQRQMALLNTNTRYRHPLRDAYTARLLARFPDPLNVVYFVCTGSEANELALRLARAYTGRRDVLVLDGAYHGNTGELVNISPYKFNGPGGQGAPEYVHVLPLPDPYRGPYKGYGRETGRRYAAHVQERIAQMPHPPAAFIAESLPGCGGQIVLPDGYLAHAYARARAAGAVCIADEVQVGFGRVGSHWWGFETQGVVPDIVTLGKPMGNGHPVAAVVTTREIAQSFANGMEYFNTYGGNPVSCAIGLAVLDVIEEEKLRENALAVGNHLLAGLRRLQEKHPLIGDARGRGLYIGVELVRDRETLEPADTEAHAIVNGMKERGILLSTDGPLHNVLKIKPPLVFTRENADFLVATLDEVLATV